MKLVVMTQPTCFVEEDKIITALFDEGLDKLHLYKPNTELVYSERLFSLIPEDYHKKIVLCNHFSLLREYNIRGIHIVDSVSDELPNINRSISVIRTCIDITHLKELKKKADYVFLKTDLRDREGEIQFLLEASKKGLIDKKVYALGGIDLSTIRVAKSLGFGGVVLNNALWQQFDVQSDDSYKGVIDYFCRIKEAI